MILGQYQGEEARGIQSSTPGKAGRGNERGSLLRPKDLQQTWNKEQEIAQV